MQTTHGCANDLTGLPGWFYTHCYPRWGAAKKWPPTSGPSFSYPERRRDSALRNRSNPYRQSASLPDFAFHKGANSDPDPKTCRHTVFAARHGCQVVGEMREGISPQTVAPFQIQLKRTNPERGCLFLTPPVHPIQAPELTSPRTWEGGGTGAAHVQQTGF